MCICIGYQRKYFESDFFLNAGFSIVPFLHFMGLQWITYMYIQPQQFDETLSDEEIEDGYQDWQKS